MKGDVIVIDFPFSDLSKFKNRPAFLVTEFDAAEYNSGAIEISSLGKEEVILCQITGTFSDSDSIKITNSDFISFVEGKSLNKDCYVRPNKIFTFSKDKIKFKIGTLNQKMIDNIIIQIKNVIER